MDATLERPSDPVAPLFPSFESLMLRDALASGAIFPYYQPKFDLRTGAMSGVEALARWRHPQLGLLSPNSFVPALMRLGMSCELTAAMVRHACEAISGWKRDGHNIKVAVNAAWTCVEDGDFLAY